LKKRSIYIFFTILLIFSSATIAFSSKTLKAKNHTFTEAVKIVDKYWEEGSHFIKVRTIEPPPVEGEVFVENENVWNLIEVNEEYFTVISSSSVNSETAVFTGENLKLEQVDIMD
jgi:hypothetical protein